MIPSGRIVDIAVSELTDRTKGARVGKTFYVATATGGVWKSTDGGTTFEPVFDRVGPNSIGAVAVAPSNPEVVWVGTGEANNQRSVSFGDGIYKSENGGKRWEHMGLQSSQHISRIAIHPTDPDIVYVAANGPLWESGGERGLYKTADGGVTWTSVLMISEHTGVTDVVLDPQDPDVVYASAFQRQRKAYDFVGGGPESGIHKSMDGGASWEELTVGLPDGDMGRIGLTIAASQPRTLYAVIETRDWGVWRSDDYGASWRRTAGRVFGYPWYMGVIKADPTEPERVWVLGVPLLVSEDGGENFETRGATTHVDHHAMWIDPTDSDNMILGNDGGLYFSHDQGFNWRIAVNLPVAQFYAIGTDMREPYHVYGGTQDNNVWTAPNMSRDRSGVTMSDWTNVCCGDGFYSVIDPVEPHIVYSESQYGAIIRFDANTGEAKGIRPPESLVGEPYRWNWSAPILISPHDRKTIYFAANYLFRSPDRGDGWEVLGGDMTRGIDRDTMMMMGRRWGPGSVALHSGVAEYGNISTLDESPLREGLLYVGTDDGLIQISKDGGESWTKVESFPGVPALTYVSRVTASSHDEGTVYATFDGHRDNDFKPYIHKSTDYGESWTSIALGMPEFGSTHVIREHPENPRLLFVGTEFGVHFSTDGGERWRSLRNNMPIVIVRDLLIHPRDNDLVVGTHGRGIYILDDITPLVELAPAEETPLIHLFPVDPVTQFNQSSRKIGDARGPGAVADAFWAGENPVVGALIGYHVGDSLKGRGLSLSIVNAEGDIVRTLTARNSPGIHRVTWNLRLGPPYVPGNRGPLALPGEYAVRLAVDAKGQDEAPVAAETALHVAPDPLVTLTEAEYRELHELRVEAANLSARLQNASQTTRDLRAELDQAIAMMRSVDVPDRLKAMADSTSDELNDIIEKLTGRAAPQRDASVPSRPQRSIQAMISSVTSQIGGVSFPATPLQRDQLREAAPKLDAEIARIQRFVEATVPAFHRALDEAGVPWTPGRRLR